MYFFCLHRSIWLKLVQITRWVFSLYLLNQILIHNFFIPICINIFTHVFVCFFYCCCCFFFGGGLQWIEYCQIFKWYNDIMLCEFLYNIRRHIFQTTRFWYIQSKNMFTIFYNKKQIRIENVSLQLSIVHA